MASSIPASASSAEDAREAEFLAYMKTAKQAKEEYAQHYREMVDTLSTDHLEDFATVFQASENIVINKVTFLEEIKERFLGCLLTSMDQFWENKNVAKNMSTLEMLKSKFQNVTEPNWRPHGKDVYQQTLPIRIHKKEAERRNLRKQIALQNSKLEEIMRINADNRDRINNFRARRRYITERMQSATDQLKNVEAEYHKYLEKVEI